MVQPVCDPHEYIDELTEAIQLPQGFRFYVDSLTFVPRERPAKPPLRMNVSALISEVKDTTAAGVTTRNRFPGAPVQLTRERLPAGKIQGVVVNNRIANVASPSGYPDAVTVARTFAERFSLPEEQTLSLSTGIIGWQLPVEPMVAAIKALPGREGTVVDFARGIMTTDRYPKVAWNSCRQGPRLVGVAKGAGMIEPNLATMLGFFVTDAQVDQTTLDRVFRRVVDRTFNTISVDGDQSTSDTVLLMANGASGITLSEEELEQLLVPVAHELVLHIVRNGEGTAHVIEVVVRGVSDASLARALGKHIVNSPLVKTAVYGNDPNVGRILAAAGDALDQVDPAGRLDANSLCIHLFGEEVYRNGAFSLDGGRENRLSDALVAASFDPALRGCPQIRENVRITLTFGTDNSDHIPEERVFGSDLSYEYVRENADYRS